MPNTPDPQQNTQAQEPEQAQPDPVDDPIAIILYGGTGDLARRMVLPAIYQLFTRGLLPRHFKLIGNGRGDVSDEDFATHIREALDEFATEPEDEEFAEFAQNVSFAGGGFRENDPGTLLDAIKQAEDAVPRHAA